MVFLSDSDLVIKLLIKVGFTELQAKFITILVTRELADREGLNFISDKIDKILADYNYNNCLDKSWGEEE